MNDALVANAIFGSVDNLRLLLVKRLEIARAKVKLLPQQLEDRCQMGTHGLPSWSELQARPELLDSEMLSRLLAGLHCGLDELLGGEISAYLAFNIVGSGALPRPLFILMQLIEELDARAVPRSRLRQWWDCQVANVHRWLGRPRWR